VNTLAPLLQTFFTDRLVRQRQVSDHTIAAYRDAIKLLLTFAAEQTGKTPSRLDLADLDAPLIGAFLDHLQQQRANSVRTRNARLAAIHSLFRHAALQRPEDAAVIARVLAIPPKRFDATLVTYLTEDEVDALLAACDQATWTGRRDRALLMLACQTGLRASGLTHLTIGDVHLGAGPHVSCLGKGRKQRITPLTADTVTQVRAWLTERGGQPDDPLFPTRAGTTMTRDALERLVAKHTGHRSADLPDPAREEDLTPHHAAHRRNETPCRRHRRRRDRLVARARKPGHHADVHPRRSRPQGEGTGPHRPAAHRARPLPAPRHPVRLCRPGGVGNRQR
jgi:integrase/recombinase XerD